MSYKTIIAALSASAVAMALPAVASAQTAFYFGVQSAPHYGYYDAPTYGYYNAPRHSRHDHEHEHLDEQHGDVHDELDYQHARAHEEGLSPWEHAQLHDELNYQHAQADYQIAREHQRQHRYRSWQRNYSNYGYDGYYRY